MRGGVCIAGSRCVCLCTKAGGVSDKRQGGGEGRASRACLGKRVWMGWLALAPSCAAALFLFVPHGSCCRAVSENICTVVVVP